MIRESKLSELPVIINLKIKMFEDANLVHLLNDNAKEIIEITYLQLYKNSRMKHFVMEINDEIVGIAGAFIKDEIPYCFYRTLFYGFIGDVYIKKDHRRKGYARQLTEQAIAWLKSQDVKMIKLLATPEAEKLYKDFGFINTTEMTLIIKE